MIYFVRDVWTYETISDKGDVIEVVLMIICSNYKSAK